MLKLESAENISGEVFVTIMKGTGTAIIIMHIERGK